MERIENTDAPDVERLLAVVEDSAGQDAFDAKRLKPLELFDEILRKGRGGLDLYRCECTLFSDEQIDLVAVRVPEEIYLRPDSSV